MNGPPPVARSMKVWSHADTVRSPRTPPGSRKGNRGQAAPAVGASPTASDREQPGRKHTPMDDSSNLIPEDLQPYAKQVLSMDPIDDVPPNVQHDVQHRPINLKIDALPPEMRSEVHRQIELRPNMPPEERAKLESRLVAEAVKSRLGTTRATTGIGADATKYHKEIVSIAGQVNDLSRERATYQTALDEIASLEKGFDPDTGEMVANPVYRLTGERRKAYTEAVARIDNNIGLLVKADGSYGIEGERRVRQALFQAAADLKRVQEMRADEVEARKRAEAMQRDARINQRVEALNRMGPRSS